MDVNDPFVALILWFIHLFHFATLYYMLILGRKGPIKERSYILANMPG